MEWQQRQKDILDVIQLVIPDLPTDLVPLILSYCPSVQWETTSIDAWKFQYAGWCKDIILHEKKLYLVDAKSYSETSPYLHTYTIKGENLDYNGLYPLHLPWGMDFDKKNEHLYIIDRTSVSRFSLSGGKSQLSWKLPHNDGGRGVKINNNLIYCTIQNRHQIFVYSMEAQFIKALGMPKKGSTLGLLNTPYGIDFTSTTNHIHICDKNNHRISVWNKENGTPLYSYGKQGTQEGEFSHPYTIFIDKENNYDDIVYIGDQMSVQIFTVEGQFLQRLGGSKVGKGLSEFNTVYGIYVDKEELYVSDFSNQRIQVFRKKKELESSTSDSEK